MSAGGTDLVQVPIAGSGDLRRPRWSRDQSRLVFVRVIQSEYERRRSIEQVGLDGSFLRTLVQNPPRGVTLPGMDLLGDALAWAPSEQIAFSSGFSSRDGRDFASVNVIAADGVRSVALPDIVGGLDWSPDGSRLVFIDADKSEVVLVGADGRGQTTIVSEPGGLLRGAVWSPDGSRIAFGQLDNDSCCRRFTLSLVDPDGSRLERVAGVAVDELGGWQAIGFVPSAPTPNRAPSASFSVSPASGNTATTFGFDGTGSSDPDGDVLTYTWAPGDGTSAIGSTTTHSYAMPGTYTATLTVVDGRGGTATTTRSVTVTTRSVTVGSTPNRAPFASFGVVPSTGTTTTSFGFDGTGSSDPDGDVLTYAWAFGDGAVANGSTTTHSYAMPGTYTATLTVEDGRGGTATTTRIVTGSECVLVPTGCVLNPHRAGYCMPQPVLRADGTMGLFVDLVRGQPEWDPRYREAVLAALAPGVGLTCDRPYFP